MPDSDPSRFSDLAYRIISAIILVIIGGGALYLGGAVFVALCTILSVLMAWELQNLGRGGGRGDATHTMMRWLLCAAIAPIWVADYVSQWWVLWICAIAALIIMFLSVRQLRYWCTFALMLVGAGIYSVLFLRAELGLWVMIWLLGVVVLTDIGGYLIGRILGGAKLWPAISPKKTWSGTVGGWVCAMAFSLGFAPVIGGNLLAVVSAGLLISLSSQMGDLFFSYLKRKAGQKDYGTLLPGHGGLLDRFDGMIAACALAGMVTMGCGQEWVI